MPLTRVKIDNLDTTVEYFADPIIGLNSTSTLANTDIGFIFNRGGTGSNVAVYWNETTDQFILGFTGNSGLINSNIAVSQYANLTVNGLTGTLLTNAQPNINSLGTITSLNVQGTIQTLGYIYGNSGIGGTLITASQPNITTLAGVTSIGASSSTTLTGILQTASQTNITAVGNLTSLSVGGTSSYWGAATFYNGITGTLQTASQPNITTLGAVTAASINNAIIGNATPASGDFTRLAATGIVYANSIALASGTTTGGLVVTGGLGVGLSVYARDIQATAIGNVTASTGAFTTLQSTSTTTLGALSAASINNTVIGNATPASGDFTRLAATGIHYANSSTTSTSISTGGLVVAGGLGVAGNIYATTHYGNIGGGSVLTDVYITGNLIPSANVVYNLGSPTNKFHSAYFGANTVYIGSESISLSQDGLGTWSFTSNGSTVQLGSAVSFNPPSANVSGNVIAGNITTGNINAGNIISAYIYGTTYVSAGAVYSPQIGNTGATLTGTLSTASQPNITTLAGVTSIGASGSTTLTGTLQTVSQPNLTTLAGLTNVGNGGNLTVNGNLIVTGEISVIGNVTQVQITGNSGQFFGNVNGFGALYAGIGSGYLIEPQTTFQISSNYNGYAMLNMQNINAGPLASSDLILTPNNGSPNDTFFDIGVASSTYNYPGYSLIKPNDGYLIAYGNSITGGGNLLLSTGMSNDIVFAVGGANVSNEIGRFSNSTTSLIMKGSVNPSTASNASVSLGTSTQWWSNFYAVNHYGTIQTASQTNITTLGNLTAMSSAGNITVYGNGQFSGPYTENTTIPGVFIGNAGSGTPSPRVGFFTGNATQNWQIDNYGGSFRWFTPGTTRMTLDINGNLIIPATTTAISTGTGALQVSGGAGIQGNLYATIGVFTSNVGTSVGYGNTAQRPSSPTTGQIRYNTDTGAYEGYYVNNWGPLGNAAAIPGGSANQIIYNSGGTSFGGAAALQYFSGNTTVLVSGGVASSSTTSGALQVAGGVGVTGAITSGNILIGQTPGTGLGSYGLISGSSAYLTILGARLGDTGSQVTGVGALELQGGSASGSGLQSKIDFVAKATSNVMYNTARIAVTNSASDTATGQLAFYTRNGSGGSLTEQMRIDEQGNVFIARSSSTAYSNVTIYHTTPSSSTTTGALVVNGGAGIAGNINAGNVSATYIVGNGSLLTGLPAGYANTNVAAYLPGYTGASGITSVGTLTGLTVSGLVNYSLTTANTATAIFTHGSDVNFQLTAQNGVGYNTTGSEVARFGINYNTAGWDSFTQYVRGASSQNGYQSLWASNTPIANVTSSGVSVTGTVTATTFSGAGTSLTGTASSLSIGGAAPAGSLTGSTLASGVTASSLTSVGTLTGLTSSGNISAPTMNVTHTTVGSTYGNQSIIGVWSGSDGSNNEFLELTNTRTAAGSTWTTAGYRLQQKIDATWMGYVQFNGASTNGGIAFGTGTNTTNAVSVTDSVRIDTNGVTIVGLKNQTVAIANGGTSGVGNIGATGATFNTVFAKATTAQYADLAEKYSSDKKYVPGTVVVFGGDKEITISTQSHDPSIAGVVSTDPAYLMNSEADGLPIALQGRVPCRVQGPVAKGDRLVASNIKGVAIKLDKTLYEPGCIIGKALEDITDDCVHTIEVVVGRV